MKNAPFCNVTRNLRKLWNLVYALPGNAILLPPLQVMHIQEPLSRWRRRADCAENLRNRTTTVELEKEREREQRWGGVTCEIVRKTTSKAVIISKRITQFWFGERIFIRDKCLLAFLEYFVWKKMLFWTATWLREVVFCFGGFSPFVPLDYQCCLQFRFHTDSSKLPVSE